MERLVIIPTYNEKENIEAIIRAVMSLPIEFHILIIDDGSPDGTASIVKNLMASEFADRLFIEAGQARTRHRIYMRLQVGYRA